MGKKTNRQPFRGLPFVYYYSPMVLITLIGLGTSLYLALSHYRVHTDPTYSSFCAVSRAFNCDTVSSSPYAVLLNVPMAIWGVIGYLIVLAMVLLAGHRGGQKKRLWPTLFWILLVYSICSIILAAISTLMIHSYCIMCMLTYMVNFSLLYYAWFVNRRFGDSGLFLGLIGDIRFLWTLRKVCIPVFAGCLVLTGGLMAFMPAYWRMEAPPLTDSLPHGVTDSGYHWIGAEHPTLTITEFSDYMCFQCRKMHFFLRELVQTHPNQIRLIHRHFPMDHAYNPIVDEPFHTGAGKMALIGLIAGETNHFWEVNDLLFSIATQKQDFNTKAIAQLMGMTNNGLVAALNNKYIRLRLKHDIAVGIEEGITGTPGFIINGNVYQGSIPGEILKEYVK